MKSVDVSQGKFHVRRELSGGVRIECPPVMVLSPEFAVKIAKGILQAVGVEVQFAELGQTVIRPPADGKVLRG